MRRMDKQINDRNLIAEIINQNSVCRIALADEDKPYLVPMSYGFMDGKIYLHSAKEGQKIDIIKKNNKVCFEISDSIEILGSGNACDFGLKYRSVIGFGRISIVSDSHKKIEALKIIMRQHTGKTAWEFGEAVLNKVAVLKIQIDSLNGKISGI